MTEGLSVVTAALTCPVTLVDLKRHMRIQIDDDEQDELIDQHIWTTTDWAEVDANRCFVERTLKIRIDKFASSVIKIAQRPLISVDSVKYYNISEVLTTVATSVYEAVTDRLEGFIRLKYNQSWPTDLRGYVDDVEVQFKAGSSTVAAIPSRYKSAIMLLAAHMYENREAFDVATQAARFSVPGYMDLVQGGNYVYVTA